MGATPARWRRRSDCRRRFRKCLRHGVYPGGYATAKYDPDGNELWVALYTEGEVPAWPVALAVDADDSVVVTGTSHLEEKPDPDMATVKYDANGNELWVARYDNGAWDDGYSLALDGSGNVYVTGQTEGVDPPFILKYDAGGNQLWVALNHHGGSLLSVDSAGFVYSAGRSGLVKYDTDGDEIWTVESTSVLARAMALDSSGNVLVAGESSSGDYATAKYDPQGSHVWLAFYDGPSLPTSGDDSATALALDSSGNLYVTGSSGTVKYDIDGNRIWVAGLGTLDARALALDAAGDVYVAGESGGDYATAKYDGEGHEVWVARYDGPEGGDDHATALAVDDAGNVHVTGVASGGYVTAKYDTAGGELWTARVDVAGIREPVFGEDVLPVIAIDGDGNVYVAGSSCHPKECDSITVKYDSEGNELWIATWDFPEEFVGKVSALTVDASGNVYVAGWGWLLKYDANGDEIWGGLFTTSLDFVAMALDGEGNICLTGALHFFSELTMKVDPEGNTLWTAGSGEGLPRALAVDPAGNVYVVTAPASPDSASDYFTMKYDKSGYGAWSATYDGPAGGRDVSVAIAVDVHGGVYVTGESEGSDTGLDYATVKYVTVPCPPEGDTRCDELTVDPPGGPPGAYRVTAAGTDDSGDPIRYTFTLDNGVDPPTVLDSGFNDTNVIVVHLDEGDWTISATVDGDPDCPDEATNPICSVQVSVGCPQEGDTHCDSLEVSPGGQSRSVIARAAATDDSGDPILYTFTADNGMGTVEAIGPQTDNTAYFVLAPGPWTITVTVVDDLDCPGMGEDNRCSEEIVVACPAVGDTHCSGFEVVPATPAGMFIATATARDDSGDPILYTFTMDDGSGSVSTVGPLTEATTGRFPLTVGTWTITVTVDDDPVCPDAAADSSRSVEIDVTDSRVPGLQVPGDCNGDSSVDISDAVCTFGILFLGSPPRFPCGDGLPTHAANIALMDWQPDAQVDLSDGIALLQFLFLGGRPHASAVPELETSGCIPILGCPDRAPCHR